MYSPSLKIFFREKRLGTVFTRTESPCGQRNSVLRPGGANFNANFGARLLRRNIFETDGRKLSSVRRLLCAMYAI